MKKITLAACLILASGSAFSQTGPGKNANDHGQNDCQCVGIGIPNTSTEKSLQVKTGRMTEQPNKMILPGGLWYLYLEIYLKQISSIIPMKHQ
jgi:hypothetical protein